MAQYPLHVQRLKALKYRLKQFLIFFRDHILRSRIVRHISFELKRLSVK